jgi:hypothetical protein
MTKCSGVCDGQWVQKRLVSSLSILSSLREGVGNNVGFTRELLAVFSDAKGDVVCGVHPCYFQSHSGFNGVIAQLTEVCLAEPPFGSGAVGH